ncbi:hypothetical protein DFR55_101254 [Herbinix hemicellulosilytica]|uniref:Putative membrane protein n=1 Tax=Herbinix hemicellulosilytica TaxID=1564487 RepID=A0A0H5SI45_HERHM|nr:hypothetical protein [Herbinix hemicellulosilytica]RBP60794.1 hypothetical protein DFR55_101254 [Herbinix hemicellulosilytica]CRZ34481.1 putative membrane protein [Herbinix hemicellulosilytica]
MKKYIKFTINKIHTSFIMQLIVCIVLSLIIIFTFYVFNKKIEIKKFREYTIENNINLINSIESVVNENDRIIIQGYAFILGKNTLQNEISVFLKNIENNEEIWLEVEQMNRNDVNSYFECEYDFTNSGFVATTKEKKLKRDNVYEILINIDYKDVNNSSDNIKVRKTVSSNRFILNNTLYAYNPNDFDYPILNIESELIKEVFINGQLCFYKKDIGMYVYFYEDKLYWIATENFDFDENGKTYILYHVYTSQTNKLPEKRVQYKFDNLDFIFEDYEYKIESVSPYRVAIRKIPENYSITYIRTGVNDRKIQQNIWTKMFHLDHFKNINNNN